MVIHVIVHVISSGNAVLTVAGGAVSAIAGGSVIYWLQGQRDRRKECQNTVRRLDALVKTTQALVRLYEKWWEAWQDLRAVTQEEQVAPVDETLADLEIKLAEWETESEEDMVESLWSDANIQRLRSWNESIGIAAHQFFVAYRQVKKAISTDNGPKLHVEPGISNVGKAILMGWKRADVLQEEIDEETQLYCGKKFQDLWAPSPEDRAMNT